MLFCLDLLSKSLQRATYLKDISYSRFEILRLEKFIKVNIVIVSKLHVLF